MRDRLPPLNSLRAFDAAARHLSFQRAAEELNVTPSALSFQIRQLEEFLQLPLFERLNRGVALTEAGARFAPSVQDGFERLHAAMNQLKPSTPDDVLTVTTGPSFAAKWLSPRIHRFLEQYPEIELRIAANLSLSDLRKDAIDVAIRFGAGHYPGLRVEPLAEDAVLPLISPVLLAERFGGALTFGDLAALTLLHDDSAAFLPNAVTWATWLKQAGADGIDPSRGARFNHADHALEAAVDQAGIALGRLTLAARDIRAGRLVAPFDLVMPANASFYFCCLPQVSTLPKIEAFRGFVREEIEGERAELDRMWEGR
ncbi:MAG: transcriptional regulator GcvA [Roseitalea porphyridii]|uniref:transcriptional regulator GcvA n=1 Tax=Hyphomicrobiales TaxID=356 RepID=UPI0032EE2555